MVNKLLLVEIALKCRIRPLFFSLFCFRPCMVSIRHSASIEVKNHLLFNRNHDHHRIMRNKKIGSLYVGEKGVLQVDSFAMGPGCEISVNPGARLSLGTGYCLSDTIIDCFNEISIGNDCMISKRVLIRDSNNHTITNDANYMVSSPIHIGNHVWIGMGVTILPGVSIGDGSIIAAGAIVTKPVQSHCLVGGVPARVLKENVEWR